MIELQPQLEAGAIISWSTQVGPDVAIDWLHGENKVYTSVDQRVPARGPATVVPTAVFTIGEGLYMWEEVEW